MSAVRAGAESPSIALPDRQDEELEEAIKINEEEEQGKTAVSDAQETKAKDQKFTEAENRRVLNKIDRRLMPIMCLVYTLQYIDKSAMSYAAVYTFRQDRNLTGRQYSWLGTVFYLGYTVFEFPGSWLLQKTKTNIFMGVLAMIWGTLLLCMAFPPDFKGLAALRTLLGSAESLVTPGFALITARFYKREEQPFRIGIWYCCNGVGSILGGFMGYGSGRIDIPSLPNWAWIFLLNGIMTVMAGLLFLVICPNSPEDARFLSHRERIVAIERIKANQSSLFEKTIKWHQIREALNPFEDPQGWLLATATFALTVPNGGLGTYLHLILQAYGYNAFQAILLGLPQGGIQVVLVLSTTYIARRYANMRIYVSIAGISLALLGILIQYCTTINEARLFGYYLIVAFVVALAQLFSMPASNVNGYSKRITIQAMVFIAYGSGNALGPTFWKGAQKPAYRDGMITCIIGFSACIVLMILLRLHYMRENALRDKRQSEEERADVPNNNFQDITDVENKSFRYLM